MKKKYPVSVLVCGAVLAVLTALDQLLWQNPATGFCTVGPYWLRYIVVGAALLAVLLPGCPMKEKSPQFINDKEIRTLRHAMMFCAAVGGAVNLLGFFLGRSDRWALGLGVLQLVSAYWLFTFRDLPAKAPLSVPERSAAFGMVGTVSLYYLTVERFMLHQTGLARVGANMNLFSAIAALLLSVAWLWMLYLPERASAAVLIRRGRAVFLLCTCGEFTRSVCLMAQGALSLSGFLCSLNLALVGLFGLYTAACLQSGETSRGDRKV